MVIAALVSFGLLVIAWLVAPADTTSAVIAIGPSVDGVEAAPLAEVA